MTKGIAFLMYHELASSGRELCDDSPGYRRYVVSEDNFKSQLAMIEASGWRCWNVTEALRVMSKEGEREEGVCLTFDDGCATDLSSAAPLLLEKKFKATFYITVNHLGKRGYLTKQELRAVETFLKRRFELNEPNRSALAARIAQPISIKLGLPPDGWSPETVLEEVERQHQLQSRYFD